MPLRYYLRRSTDYELVETLHEKLFGAHTPFEGPDYGNQYWILWSQYGEPVGYCSARETIGDSDCVFLSRAGVFADHRGSGFQRRMIKVRERWAKSLGYKTVVTYTWPTNGPSIANLVKSGYRVYDPEYEWGGKSVYFYKDIR